MWLLTLAWASLRYCLAPADPVWMCANGGRPASVCQGTCRRQQR